MKTNPIRPAGALALIAAAALVTACADAPQGNASRAAPSPSPLLANRFAQVADVLPMPAAGDFETHYLAWTDPARSREVLAKLYLPAAESGQRGPVPLVVFSHGIGGSREGYTYLGKYFASHGYASLHVQHVGSDRQLWFGNPLTLLSRLQAAAREEEALNRVRDLSFALDQVLGGPLAAQLDARRIVAAGHSYGANTVMLASGAQVRRDGVALDLRDARIRAAVIISAPPFHGEPDLAAILSPLRVPTLHITATADDIRIPGYSSGLREREAVFDATGGHAKSLVVFRDGSHSIFTDRLGTGGVELNPRVKAATREAALAFLDEQLRGGQTALQDWRGRHGDLIARFEHRL